MKNSRIKIFIAIATLVLASGVAYYFTKNRPAPLTGSGQASSPQEVQNQAPPEGQKIYENGKYGFSFSHQKEFSVSEFTEGGADVVLVRNGAANGVFKVSVSPFDEPGPITKKRILQDIPKMLISDDKEISVGGKKALSFTNKDTAGETFEIWFVYNGNLYQISAFPKFGKELDKILTTWKFQ